MARRYTLNVSKEVYTLLNERRLKELRRSDKAPTVDEILRRLLKIEKNAETSSEKKQ